MAGAGFKTFNTGDVLTASDVNTYLMQQTVMVFADSSARSTALGANVAEGMLSYLKSDDKVYSYNGSAWVAIDTGSTSPLTTKGDLYTYSTTDARLPVGSNGYTLVADSSTSTGLAYGSSALANPVINGAFDIWQRGTSIAIGTNTYSADRWINYRGAYAAGMTVSRQSVNDSTNLPNIQYCARVQRDSGNTGTQTINVNYSFETSNSIPFAGKTVTFSFYARKGADFSQSTSQLTFQLYSGTGTDQNIATVAYTGSVAQINTQATLTTSWQRFAATATMPTNMTEMAIAFAHTPSGTAGAADYYEVTGVQIDLGSTALPFRRSGGTIQGELAAAQRYYWRSSAFAGGVSALHGFGTAEGTGTVGLMLKMPSTMRVTPTAIDYASLRVFDGANLIGTPSSVALITNNSNADQAYVTFNKTSSFTQYRPYFLINDNTTSGYIGFTAEL